MFTNGLSGEPLDTVWLFETGFAQLRPREPQNVITEVCIVPNQTWPVKGGSDREHSMSLSYRDINSI
jgi:hypothetical protein